MKETIAIAIGPVVIAMMIILAWCLPKIQQQRFDHWYRLEQLKELVDQNNHRRYLEMEASGKVPSELELQARVAEANAKEQQSAIELERERSRSLLAIEKERNRRKDRF